MPLQENFEAQRIEPEKLKITSPGWEAWPLWAPPPPPAVEFGDGLGGVYRNVVFNVFSIID